MSATFGCAECHFWLRHFPNLMGVCTFEPDDPDGPVAPVSADNVGIQLSIEYANCTATAPETVCENWTLREDIELSTEEDED